MRKIVAIAAMMLLAMVAAQAAGTAAGTQIDNNATLSYSVGGVVQATTIPSNTDSFVVDRKIDFLVTNDDTQLIEVVPGQTSALTTWTLKNESNDDVNFTIDVDNLTNGETIYGGQDSGKDVSNIVIEYYDGSQWQTYNSGNKLLIAPDNNISLRVKADIPPTPTVANGDIMNIYMTATAVDGNGVDLQNTGDSNGKDRQGTVDTVLAESASVNPGSAAYDGKYSAWGGYKVVSATLDVTKISCVVKDPVSDSGNAPSSYSPKRIPGATILYVFDINNTGSADATGLNLTDVLNSSLDDTSVANVQIDTNATSGATACSCNDGSSYTGTSPVPGSNAGSGQTVKINGASVGAGKHTCISFEVEIK